MMIGNTAPLSSIDRCFSLIFHLSIRIDSAITLSHYCWHSPHRSSWMLRLPCPSVSTRGTGENAQPARRYISGPLRGHTSYRSHHTWTDSWAVQAGSWAGLALSVWRSRTQRIACFTAWYQIHVKQPQNYSPALPLQYFLESLTCSPSCPSSKTKYDDSIRVYFLCMHRNLKAYYSDALFLAPCTTTH